MMRAGLALLVAGVLSPGCAGPPSTMPQGQAPDIEVSTPMGAARRAMVVERPSWWVDHAGRRQVDPRLTVALVARDHAVWECAARLEDHEALVLSRELAAALPVTPGSDSTVTLVTMVDDAVDRGPAQHAGGGWTARGGDGAVHLDLVNRDGRLLASVRLGTVAARTLRRSIDLAVRADP